MTQDEWDELKKKTQGYEIRMGFELLHSEAYKEIRYVHTAKVLNWFHEKVKLKKNKGKRGKKRWEKLDCTVGFTYDEAEFRGLSHGKFGKALKELYKLGFIDIEKPGSGRRGDYTKFKISERWRKFDTPEFENSEFPRSVHWQNFGFKVGNDLYKKKKDKC
jgi:hypothetical protein